MNIDKNTKEYIQFIASLVVLALGIVLVGAGLVLPPIGVIHPTVITTFGMFLGFVGAVWQIDIKYSYKALELKGKYDREEETYRKRMDYYDRRIEEFDRKINREETTEDDTEELDK